MTPSNNQLSKEEVRIEKRGKALWFKNRREKGLGGRVKDMIFRVHFPGNKAVTKARAVVTALNFLKDHTLERPVIAESVDLLR